MNQNISSPQYELFEKKITKVLKDGLDERLYYHGLHHVEYVMDAALLIASVSRLTAHEFMLLKTAVLLHDAGFLTTYQDHELAGTRIAIEMLPDFGYNAKEIEQINGMILATRIPQTPQNQLEEIIADADLEYLGTDQYDKISGYLYQELLAYQIISTEDEWNRIQLKFLSEHRYYTDFCKKHREGKKQQNLERVRRLL